MLKGEASEVMTKLINDATGYIAAFSALTLLVNRTAGKNMSFVDDIFIVTAVVCGFFMFCYWVDHVVSQCEKLRKREPASLAAIFHTILIFIIFTMCYPGIVVMTIWSFLQSAK